MENPALPFIEDAEPGCEHCTILRHVVLVLLGADRLERIELLPVVASAATRGERQRRVGATGLERLENLFLFDTGPLGELRDRGRATQLHRQLLDELGKLHVELLQPAWNANRPLLVA